MSQSNVIEYRSAVDPRRWWALAATATTVLVIGLDTTILNVAVPDIAVSLHASSAQLQWFADAYLLVLGALLLPAGLLGDRYGRKRSTVVGLVVFFLGSLWCALASSAESLIAARTVLGVGAAILIPLAMSSVVVLFAAAERTRAIALLGISTMVGLPLGPILAGILLQHFWWGSVFVVNLPVIALALVAVLRFLPESVGARGRRLDLVGIVLTSAGMLAATYGVIEGPERGWTDPLVVGGLVGGVALFAAFLWWQRRDRGLEPVVDPVLWRKPAFRWGALTAAVASLAFFGAMFVVPQFLRGVLGEDALGTGVRSVPMVVGLFVGLRLTMVLLPRFGARVLGVCGFALGALGFLVGTRVSVESGYALTAVWTTLVGAGVGAALFCGQNGALGTLPRDRAAAGSALVQVLRQIGSVAGIAALGALLNAAYRSGLPSGLPTAVSSAVEQNVASGMAVAAQSGSASLEYAVRSAFVGGLTATMWVSAVICLLGAAMVWRFLPDSRVVVAESADADVDAAS
ncbi:MAG TPA: DHA2 family efflux MFS transporter permease subunit [Lapillicoccus sp.]|nr:DHA2 family efflux MFS transporter permease subunit [Lapillicoccus sp.]